MAGDRMSNAEVELAKVAEDEHNEAPPVPPKESGAWRAAALPLTQLENQAPRSVPSPSPAGPRLKKKVPWKGKNIMVLLPLDDERGAKGKAPRPMTEKDVADMLRDWEQLGYDTTGFNLSSGMIKAAGTKDDGDIEDWGNGQSRQVWPDTGLLDDERSTRDFRVSIPDRREWDAYVQELSEAKLRALGVSFGDDEPPPTISPAPSTMSRQTSTQYPPLPFSPPMPTSSAASSHINHHVNPFSPPLVPGIGLSTGQSSNPGSVASPVPFAHLQGKYNPRQSVSFSGSEHPFGSPFQYPQQSPGVWSPQQMLYQQGSARGGSPSLQSLGAMISPVSPFLQDSYFNGENFAQLQQRQQQVLQMQGSARSSPRLQEILDTETDSKLKSPKTPEQQQVSSGDFDISLQNGIDNADYHLEEQFQRQLEHQDYSPNSEHETGTDSLSTKSKDDSSHLPVKPSGLAASRFAKDSDEEENEGLVLYHPQPHSRGHSLSQRPFPESEGTSSVDEPKTTSLGDAKSAEELSNGHTPRNELDEMRPSQSPDESIANDDIPEASHDGSLDTSRIDTEPTDRATSQNSGHSVKPSISKSSVTAKEFKFNPTSNFNPGQFVFSGASIQPITHDYTSYGQIAPLSTTSSHFSNQSFGSSGGSLNIDAPPYVPAKSEFNFNTAGPTFRADAPSFTPVAFTPNTSAGSDGLNNSIFSNIDLTALSTSKATKKSKAIPIIRPDSSHSKDERQDNVMEGLDGRLTQGEGRTKRARGTKDSGDSVPLFADATLPLSDISPPNAQLENPYSNRQSQSDTENEILTKRSTDQLISKEDLVGQTATPEKQTTIQNQDLKNGWEFKQQKQAEDFNGARPFEFGEISQELPASDTHIEKSTINVEQPSDADFNRLNDGAKKHKKNSLSATAKPFEFRPGALGASAILSKDLESVAPKGLASSRFATGSSASESPVLKPDETSVFQNALPHPETAPKEVEYPTSDIFDRQPTFEEIDAVMRQLNEPTSEMRSSVEPEIQTWHQPNPIRCIQIPDVKDSSPIRLPPLDLLRSDAPSPSPRRLQTLPGEIQTFTPAQAHGGTFTGENQFSPSPAQQLNDNNSQIISDWDDVLSGSEQSKLQPRAQFFDNHVDSLVGGLLDERLGPLERTLEAIHSSLDMMARHLPSRRQQRSTSGALSDADDEDDDEDFPRRSLSPRRDRKFEKIRAIVTEALSTHQSSGLSYTDFNSGPSDSTAVLQAIESMKEQFGQSMRLDLRGEDIRNIVEEVVETRIPATYIKDMDELSLVDKHRILELEEKIRVLEANATEKTESHKTTEKNLEDKLRLAELSTQKETQELRQERNDVIEKVKTIESNIEKEIQIRRAAEDRLAEVQRLLRISSEEETRLRDAMEERELKIREIVDESDLKVRVVEEQRGKTAMRISLLEAGRANSEKSQLELQNKLTVLESELRESRQETQHWKMEAENALKTKEKHSEDATSANEDNKQLRRKFESIKVQMEESLHVRESMRAKLIELQGDMVTAACEISEENARRAKKEQELIARQEVLDAKLQAEARTRERLEQEIDRLERGERAGMRAVGDCKRMEALVADLRAESNQAQKDAMRYQREFEEARESGLSELQRTRHYMQAEIEAANHQVNVVRENLEDQVARLRAELEHRTLDLDTAREKHDMLLEESTTSRQAMMTELNSKHNNHIEDVQTQLERQLQNATEDAQRAEQHLLERLSLSSAKAEHLQDRVSHLEEKLEIAKTAANAAISHAKAVRSTSGSISTTTTTHASVSVPEKISPQALRESIMVLQEQLQDREKTIETLEEAISKVDLDAPGKISKRDDEILWLRELLAVRKGDLQDIVNILSADEIDVNSVKDAAIRLSANIQMEEQERERAVNGSSAISLPNIAMNLRDAATPRVAQAVGPLAAAWGSWRKSREPTTSDIISPPNNSTPSKKSPGTQNYLSGLLTPPASSARQISPSSAQPTAFLSTGQRLTAQQLANKSRNVTPKGAGKQPMLINTRRAPPTTPPMLRRSSYDMDARTEDFSDAGFYDDDESTVDESIYTANLGP